MNVQQRNLPLFVPSWLSMVRIASHILRVIYPTSPIDHSMIRLSLEIIKDWLLRWHEWASLQDSVASSRRWRPELDTLFWSVYFGIQPRPWSCSSSRLRARILNHYSGLVMLPKKIIHSFNIYQEGFSFTGAARIDRCVRYCLIFSNASQALYQMNETLFFIS